MRKGRIFVLTLGLALTLLASEQPAAAQAGAVEFTARVTPAAGLSEPVRGLPFYLLRKSFADIRKEADASEPHADLNTFIEKLEVSKELKAWMKRNHSVKLTGEEFLHHLKPDDILNVPEFFNAYVEHNSMERAVGFPTPKFREKDKEKDPAKYEKLNQDYRDAIKKYLVSNPQSTDGLDLEFAELDPSPKWEQLEAERLPGIRRHTLDLAQTKYLAARAETDLDGHGSFRGLAAGQYWVSTLEIEATIGDIRLRWDAPVEVRAGETTRIDLSNFNAVEPHRTGR
jgi:hypothetical protein